MKPRTRLALDRALHHAVEHLERLHEGPVGAFTGAEELRERLGGPLPEAATPAEEVIDQLVADVSGGLIGNAGGRFFSWVIGGAVPAALAADWMTSAWDQNAALHACSPAAAVVEEVCGGWLKEILQLPERASFALVTGCQMAHVTCLAAARHAILRRHDWNVETDGLFGAPTVRLLSGDQRHGSIERALRLLGFGAGSVTDLPTDELGRLRPETLAPALEESPGQPTIVLLQAGDINTGAFDPFEDLIPLARGRGAWVHVDGAIGLWVAASPRYRALGRGVNQADSWATDGHKWLNVPYDCGYAFVADREAHKAAMTYRAGYLTHSTDARDQLDWNPEWSRRARGFATYAALRELGREGLCALVERTCEHTRELVAGIASLAGAEAVVQPIINQGLVRFLADRSPASEADHDRRTDAVIQSLRARGDAFFGGTDWKGRRCMRVSVCNWQTSSEDVARAVASVARCLGEG